jgi:hypothetical protein
VGLSRLSYLRNAALNCSIVLACLIDFGTVPCKATTSVDLGALEADRTLSAALTKSDKAMVSTLLDKDFAWTNVDGKTRTKAEALESIAELSSVNQGDTDVQTHDYGEVERIVGVHHGDRFVRLWVKRPAGWRAFILIDTPIPENGYSNHPSPPREPGIICTNPCEALPYKPENAAQEAAMQCWLQAKVGEWHALKDDWPKHISDSMLTISPTMWLTKVGRLDLLAKQYDAYGEGSPGVPVESMRMFDFGDVVIMTAVHGARARTGKRSYAVRMMIKESDGWKMALSAQTDIKEQENQ